MWCILVYPVIRFSVSSRKYFSPSLVCQVPILYELNWLRCQVAGHTATALWIRGWALINSLLAPHNVRITEMRFCQIEEFCWNCNNKSSCTLSWRKKKNHIQGQVIYKYLVEEYQELSSGSIWVAHERLSFCLDF